MKMKKHLKKKHSLASSIGFGLGASVLFTLVGSALAALILMRTECPTDAAGAASIAVLMLSAAAAAFASVRFAGEGGFTVGLCVSMTAAVMLLVLGLILGKGGALVPVLLNSLIYLGVGALSSYLFTRKRERRPKRRMR